MTSLQDQLLKAGLADAKKAKKIQKEKRKQAKQQPKGTVVEDEIKLAAKVARAEQAERAKQLNLERQKALAQKELKAQVGQIIATHKINRAGGDVTWQFVDGTKIKKIYVTGVQREQLSRGHLAVVRSGENFEIIPPVIADKISERSPETVAYRFQKDASAANEVLEDDPYADYPIPDDLDW